VRLGLHPEARAELRSAALWYDERRPGLGDEFISEVSAALGRNGDVPESYPLWPHTRAAGPLIPQGDHPTVPLRDRVRNARAARTRPGIAHAKRRPLYWLTRTNPWSKPVPHDTRLRFSSCRIQGVIPPNAVLTAELSVIGERASGTGDRDPSGGSGRRSVPAHREPHARCQRAASGSRE
jgi:hypothetical protein